MARDYNNDLSLVHKVQAFENSPTLGRPGLSKKLVNYYLMKNGNRFTDQPNYATMEFKDEIVNRDPRLAKYILFNGATFKEKAIITGTYPDAENKQDNNLNQLSTSTRTGYYLRKLLREDCNANPNSLNAKFHIPVRIRYTEIFLAYAEAANDAWGPMGKGSNAYSAYDVVKAIRARGGVGTDNGDAYLESIKGDKEKMTQLIRNERRIELCFENKRFWDIRRWQMPLAETAKGMRIDKVGESLNYTVIDVENRNYKEYMNYGPIPYGEMLKWSNLQQNKGW